jgi:predicted TIM-barrel fold metal-dependent hydrolase
MHVTDPVAFPVDASATYTPHVALLSEAQANASRIRIPNLVFVQPSTYGLDNRCLLSALRTVGSSRGRGVVVFDPKTVQKDDLLSWHRLGVRAARINLKSVGRKMEKEELLALITEFADVVRPLGNWAVQVFVDLPEIASVLEELVIERLRGVKLVIDHFGLPSDISGQSLLDCKGGLELKKAQSASEDVFVKVSGPYRMSKQEGWWDLERFTKDVFELRGGMTVVFASDWPHTRFEGLDIMPWVERCLEWCDGDKSLIQRLFRDNARVLWDVQDG